MSKYLKMSIVGVATALAASIGVVAPVTAAPSHSLSASHGHGHGVMKPMIRNWCC